MGQWSPGTWVFSENQRSKTHLGKSGIQGVLGKDRQLQMAQVNSVKPEEKGRGHRGASFPVPEEPVLSLCL